MDSARKLSKQALERMPVYMAYLKALDQDEARYISAATVAKALDLNDVQVRKDLAAVCTSRGIPKRGFAVRDLIAGISTRLGYESATEAVIVGAGNLGMALYRYGGFENYGIKIVAAFDMREELVDNRRIFPMSRLGEICREKDIKMGIITVPAHSAQQVCALMVQNGIKGIWNFAPTHLKVPPDILVQNENMASSLALLSNHLRKKMNFENHA